MDTDTEIKDLECALGIMRDCADVFGQSSMQHGIDRMTARHRTLCEADADTVCLLIERIISELREDAKCL